MKCTWLLLIMVGLAGLAQADSNLSCQQMLSPKDIAHAFGVGVDDAEIHEMGGGNCLGKTAKGQVVVETAPWNDRIWQIYLGNDCASGSEPVNGVGAKAVVCGSNLVVLNSAKNLVAGLQLDGEGLSSSDKTTINIQLARAIDANTSQGKARSTHVPTAANKAKPVTASHSAQILSGFDPDVKICPANNAMEINRYTTGNTRGVVWMLTGATEQRVRDYYQSTLTKKGWTIQSSEFHAPQSNASEQAQAAGYTGTGVMTFVKGTTTVEIGISSAGGGIGLNITQTNQ